MNDTFTEEQLRNWAENVLEPTVRDLARALLAKTAECEAWRSEAIVRQHELDEARASYCKAADERTAERQRADAAERELIEHSDECHVEGCLNGRLEDEAFTCSRCYAAEKQRAEAAARAADFERDLAARTRLMVNRLEAQLAKVPHLVVIKEGARPQAVHANPDGTMLWHPEHMQKECARFGGRCAALAAEKDHWADPEAGTE